VSQRKVVVEAKISATGTAGYRSLVFVTPTGHDMTVPAMPQ
jgi:hypothetical protein